MTITFEPETEQFLEEEARKEGLRDAATLVKRLVDRHKAQKAGDPDAISDEELRQTEAWRIVEQLAGTATRDVTTDQLMAETRSEV